MPYITTADLAELGYKWDSTTEPELSEMCVTACLMVDSYIQRVLPGKLSLEDNDIEESAQVRVVGGITKFFPTYYKTNSVESIKILANPFTNYEVLADNFKIQRNVIVARALLVNGEYYATIKYNAGFAPISVSNDVTDPITGITTTVISQVSTLPVEIKKAAILIAQGLLTEFFMVKNFNIGMLTHFKQGNLQFQRSSKILNQPIPPSAQLLLAEYRRVR